MSAALSAVTPRTTRAFRLGPVERAAALAVFVYAIYATQQLDFTWARFVAGLGHGATFVSRMFPPALDKFDILWKGLAESLQIAALASALGISLALPLSVAAARNLMPAWVSWPARALVSSCRALHPVIVAILFVKAVGFGALAGVLALTVSSVGFIGKLFTEAIEDISARQVEAIRATGAGFASVILFGVFPQVVSRFVGFATYQVDSNLRNSTMVGIVGAGGLGATLFAAFGRFDYDFVLTILVTIVSFIVAGELLANFVKRVFDVAEDRRE